MATCSLDSLFSRISFSSILCMIRCHAVSSLSCNAMALSIRKALVLHETDQYYFKTGVQPWHSRLACSRGIQYWRVAAPSPHTIKYPPLCHCREDIKDRCAFTIISFWKGPQIPPPLPATVAVPRGAYSFKSPQLTSPPKFHFGDFERQGILNHLAPDPSTKSAQWSFGS